MLEVEYKEEEDEIPVPLTPVKGPNQSPQTVRCGELNVLFPYDPYKCQMIMMKEMIKGLNSGQNCLLESPTGTGKTAALLCASLAWLENERKRNPDSKVVVIYASRTHSQLQQVIEQLKKTPYKSTPMVILASRAKTCINAEAQSSGAVDVMCEVMRGNSDNPRANEHPKNSGRFPTCTFYETVRTGRGLFEEKFKEENGSDTSGPWDLEDLDRIGKKCNTCPYYEIKEMQPKAKLVLCTYNHVLHPWIRRALRLELAGNIVILDEAHNIESNCREIASRKISLEKLERTIVPALNEASARDDIPERKQEPLKYVKVAFTELLNWMRKQKTEENNHKFQKLGDSEVQKIANPLAVFNSIGLGPEGQNILFEQMLILSDRHYNYPYDPEVAKFKLDSKVTRSINSILFTFHTLYKRDRLRTQSLHMRLQHYSVDLEKTSVSNDKPTVIELAINCLSPHVVFQDMKFARSVIVASGTLSPRNSFATELGMPFQHELSAPHVIETNRIFARIIRNSWNENDPKAFRFNHNTLQEEKQFSDQAKALGNLLLQVRTQIQKGILVLFPSKHLATSLKTSWEADGTLKRLCVPGLRKTFFEHEIDTANFKNALEEYRSAATSDGAIMFAFLRGRISEGIDFSDDQARAVITVGIPFGPMQDLKIVRKREYNDDRCKKYPNDNRLRGWDWYRIDAFRALNQGFGRCIRHRDDWGVILMVDERYSDHTGCVSAWVRSALPERDVGKKNIEEELGRFLTAMQISEEGVTAAAATTTAPTPTTATTTDPTNTSSASTTNPAKRFRVGPMGG